MGSGDRERSRAERWRTTKDLLAAALELPRSERVPFLDLRCADDPELEREVISLLDALEDSGDFLDPGDA